MEALLSPLHIHHEEDKVRDRATVCPWYKANVFGSAGYQYFDTYRGYFNDHALFSDGFFIFFGWLYLVDSFLYLSLLNKDHRGYWIVYPDLFASVLNIFSSAIFAVTSILYLLSGPLIVSIVLYAELFANLILLYSSYLYAKAFLNYCEENEGDNDSTSRHLLNHDNDTKEYNYINLALLLKYRYHIGCWTVIFSFIASLLSIIGGLVNVIISLTQRENAPLAHTIPLDSVFLRSGLKVSSFSYAFWCFSAISDFIDWFRNRNNP